MFYLQYTIQQKHNDFKTVKWGSVNLPTKWGRLNNYGLWPMALIKSYK